MAAEHEKKTRNYFKLYIYIIFFIIFFLIYIMLKCKTLIAWN